MLERALQLQTFFQRACVDPALEGELKRLILPTDADWLVIRETVKILLVVVNGSKVVMREDVLSLVMAVVFRILDDCNSEPSDLPSISSFKLILGDEIRHSFCLGCASLASHVSVVANYLDPRFKSLPFLTSQQKSTCEVELEKIADRINWNSVNMRTNTQEQPVGGKRAKQSVNQSLGSSANARDAAAQSSFAKEIMRYRLEEPASLHTDVLQYWREKETTYPILSAVARQVLAIPATRCPAEREFSSAGDLISQRRAALTSECAERIIALHEWHRSSNKGRATESAPSDDDDDSAADSDEDCKIVVS